jgi:hypothetical protein
MPVDYYPNMSVADLEALLTRMQKREALGGVTEVQVAGQRTTKDFRKNSRSEVELKRVLYSLFLRARNPDGSPGKYSDPYAGMIRRTKAFYTYG